MNEDKERERKKEREKWDKEREPRKKRDQKAREQRKEREQREDEEMWQKKSKGPMIVSCIVLFFIFEVIEYRIETTYIPPVGVEVYSVKSVEVKDWTGIVFTIPVSIVVFYFWFRDFLQEN